MRLNTLLTTIRALREEHHVRFELNRLGQLGTADVEFRDPLEFAADPLGDTNELPIAELAQRLDVSENLVTHLILVSDSPWQCALRSRLMDACGVG